MIDRLTRERGEDEKRITELEDEVERLRASHDTMTVDCQTQGCREKLNLLVMDKLAVEIERLRKAITKYLKDPKWDTDILTKALAATEAPQ